MSNNENYSNPCKKIKLDEENYHPIDWTPEKHYGMCGQSCPCCRARIEEVPLGVCIICWKRLGKK